MEDSLSVKSNESLATSDEYDFVSDKPGMSKTPTLDIGSGDLNELRNALSEVLEEPEQNMNRIIEDKQIKVGQSVFYNYPAKGTEQSKTSPTEKQDAMKPDDYSDESDNFTPTDFEEEGNFNSPMHFKNLNLIEFVVSDVDQDCTIFSGVFYLGAAAINAPKSETEIQRNMSILNGQATGQGIKVSISVPLSSQGLVVLVINY